MFDSADRKALAKALSLYGIPDKYIKVISAMYESSTAAVKLGKEVISWFRNKQGVNHNCVLSPLIWIILMDSVLSSSRKAMREHRIKWRRKTCLNLDYADGLCILNESARKMNELLEILPVQGARIGWKIMLRRLSR